MEPGQDLVAAGYAGLDATIRIAKANREELLERFSGGYLDRIIGQKEFVKMTAESFGYARWEPYGASECEPALEGGILTALWNLSGAYELGIQFSLRRIPIRQETIETCEFYGLNPYRIRSGGCAIFAAGNGGDLVEALGAKGIPAAVIGKVTGGIKRLVCQGESIGFLERPAEDEIYKVLSHDIEQ